MMAICPICRMKQGFKLNLGVAFAKFWRVFDNFQPYPIGLFCPVANRLHVKQMLLKRGLKLLLEI